MAAIRFSTAGRGSNFTEFTEQVIGHVSSQLELSPIDWGELWLSLRKVALAKQGLEASEIGTSWMGSFVGMLALRQFSPREIAYIGGADSFVPALWQSVSLLGDARVWAIPWLADTRVIYYWRDMLEDAGVDERTAFSTVEAMDDTMQRLAARGYSPWVAPTAQSHITTHHVATWIWGAGGDFVSTNGKQTLFAEPRTLANITRYFSLFQYMPKRNSGITDNQVNDLFYERRAAAMYNGYWFLSGLENRVGGKEMISRLGVALPPATPYVGGTHLVIWQHTSPRDEKVAIELIRQLVTREAQPDAAWYAGNLPVRRDLLSEPPFTTDPHFAVFAQALQTGRTFPAITLWGAIEEKLTTAFAQIWEQIRQEGVANVQNIVEQNIIPIAERLDKTLAQA